MINVLKYNKIVFGLWEQLSKRRVAGSHHTSSIHTICQPDYSPSGQIYPTLQSLWHRRAHGHIWAVNCHWPLSTRGLLLNLSFWKAQSYGHSLCPTLHPMVLLLGLGDSGGGCTLPGSPTPICFASELVETLARLDGYTPRGAKREQNSEIKCSGKWGTPHPQHPSLPHSSLCSHFKSQQ